MSHSPPIPQGNQSPYPIQEPPHPRVETPSPAVVDKAEASVADRVRDLPLLAIGAAVGLGAAVIGATVFGLLRVKPKKRGARKGRS